MGKKRKQKDKKGYKVTNEERKTHYKIRRFHNTLRRGKTVAEINSHTLRDIAGAVQILQRVAMLKSLDTSNMVKDLERQTKKDHQPEKYLARPSRTSSLSPMHSSRRYYTGTRWKGR